MILEHARRSDRGVSGFHPWNEDPFLFALLLVGDANVSLSDRAKPADRSPSLVIFAGLSLRPSQIWPELH